MNPIYSTCAAIFVRFPILIAAANQVKPSEKTDITEWDKKIEAHAD